MSIWTNIVCHLDKYSLSFGQIHFGIYLRGAGPRWVGGAKSGWQIEAGRGGEGRRPASRTLDTLAPWPLQPHLLEDFPAVISHICNLDICHETDQYKYQTLAPWPVQPHHYLLPHHPHILHIFPIYSPYICKYIWAKVPIWALKNGTSGGMKKKTRALLQTHFFINYFMHGVLSNVSSNSWEDIKSHWLHLFDFFVFYKMYSQTV